MLGISQEEFRDDLDMRVTITDFRSLLVPIRSVVDLETVSPDFAAITALCHRESIDTIALFTPIAENTGHKLLSVPGGPAWRSAKRQTDTAQRARP